MTDIKDLVDGAVNTLQPYLEALGKGVSSKLGGLAADKGAAIFRTLSNRFEDDNEASDILKNAASGSGEAENIETLTALLTLRLSKNPDLREELRQLLGDDSAVPQGQHSEQFGSNNKNSQTAGQNNRTIIR